MTNLAVAKEIQRQLGGTRFSTMTGAKNFVGDDNSLAFQLPRTRGFVKKGISQVVITLDPSDTYTVAFGKFRKHEWVEVSRHTGVYNDGLVALFEAETGLCTSLG